MAKASTATQGQLIAHSRDRSSGIPLPVKNYDLRGEMLVPLILVASHRCVGLDRRASALPLTEGSRILSGVSLATGVIAKTGG
jgi:hypothetical protein